MDIHHSETMADNAESYATDFYAWCLSTADLVRAGQWDEIDPEALAEELESLGKSQKRELESRLITLVAHLLKWEHQPLLREESHSWYDTIVEQRQELDLLLRDNPSLRPQVPALLQDGYPKARTRAIGEMNLQNPRQLSPGRVRPEEIRERVRMSTLPTVCPWTHEKVLAEDFWPAAPPSAPHAF